MTPAARVAAAIEVLDRWLDGVPAEKALTGWARGARYAGSKDRAAVRDHVYDVLRRKGACAALGGVDGRGLMLGLLRLQGVDPATVFTGEGHAPVPLSGAERQAPDASPDVWRDVPDWLNQPLRESLGAGAADIVGAMQTRAPLYLRVNARKASVNQAQERLLEDGIKTETCQAEMALKVTEGDRRLRQSSAYLDGSVEIQDLSVQLACAAVDWPQRGKVLDYCAGGGGKALAIAAVSDAQVFVHDANPSRMSDIPARAARAGVILTTISRPDDREPYDLVLCDVPCSGSGTWRRDPEAKWRLTPERLAELGQVQRQIVKQAQALVRPGGRLVYMTCSLLDAENQAVVDAALSAPDWNVLTSSRFLPPEASDGFFLAVLRRNGNG
ncbi:RsmB/NOP family class I SAM-dependent RNA methyltransferase [Nioella sediminis]|uniref:RsmB/NOP family class I SAM-dependent RNA methyltransferase n=1 Tax=Nioella sediminis TaxID=1912092 RepID=UPI0008FD3482|nr:RsmB/NOP family class I SAM-dependent RNA methyltransferase [Nioella sediminis]TBX25602.1 SAM-dependent methlyltransferase [Roseovarius sp. JS7-11]